MKKSEILFSDELREYILSTLREEEALRRLRIETSKDQNAIWQIPPEQGQFLSFLIKLLGAKKALEIGTYTGYSALCVALALPDDGKVITCDISEDFTNIGRRYWQEACVAHKIDLRIARALDTLAALIASGEAGTFDFVFIDADKVNYDHYYEKSLTLLRPGGIIAIDNVLLFGSVIDPNLLDDELRARITDEDIRVVRTLNEKIKQDSRIDETMLPLADGLTLVRKR